MFRMSEYDRLRFIDALKRSVATGDTEVIALGPRAKQFADTVVSTPSAQIVFIDLVDQDTGTHSFQLGFDELGDTEAVLG